MERRNSGSIATYQESIEDFNLIKTSSLRWYILLVFSMLGVWQVIWDCAIQTYFSLISKKPPETFSSNSFKVFLFLEQLLHTVFVFFFWGQEQKKTGKLTRSRSINESGKWFVIFLCDNLSYIVNTCCQLQCNYFWICFIGF